MAILKDLIVNGSARFIGDIYLNTIKSGTWQGSAISDSYISSASTWNAKQNALTAGSNITISGNTISATNTTYSDFIGSGANAAHGLVPKPSTTAGTTKYLREDGTWQTPPDNNTTYSAGTGLSLSSNTFKVSLPRVALDSKTLPGTNSVVFQEYVNGTSYNLPSNHYYHIITMEGTDAKYATQLALGMTTHDAYYRNYNNLKWESWSSIINTDTNNWRGILNNLTSDSTTDSLSAAQGKVLKGLIDNIISVSNTNCVIVESNLNATTIGTTKGNYVASVSGKITGTSNLWGEVFLWCSAPSKETSSTDTDNWVSLLLGLTDGRLYARLRSNGGNWSTWKKIAWTSDIPSTISWDNVSGHPTKLSQFTNDLNIVTSVGWADLINNADSLTSGNSNLTDNSEILTSYASDNGFADNNAKGKVYRRSASKIYNYIKGKLDSVYLPVGSYLTSHLDISGKVNKSGDTMSGKLTISKSNIYEFLSLGGYTNRCEIGMSCTNGSTARFGIDDNWGAGYILSYTNSSGDTSCLSLRTTNLRYSPNGGTNWYTIIHSNNIGSLTVSKAEFLTDLNSNDEASSTTANRKVWFSYNNGATGRPAISSNFTFRTDTNSLTIGGSYYANSDIRYKNIINSVNVSIESIAKLPLFNYTWKDNDILHTGSSAQAVELVLPNLVTEREDGFKSLDYATLGTVAGITACKYIIELENKINELQKQIDLLKNG